MNVPQGPQRRRPVQVPRAQPGLTGTLLGCNSAQCGD